MPRTTTNPAARSSVLLRSLTRHLSGNLEDGENRQAVTQLVTAIRSSAPETAEKLDDFWISTLARQQAGLREAKKQQDALRELLDTLTRPPLRVGRFLGSVPHGGVPTAMVMHEGAQIVVGLGEDVDASHLKIGDEIVLNHDRNLLLGNSPYVTPRCGETAIFSRSLTEDRAVLKWRDEEVVVQSGGELDFSSLKEGDRVLWDSRLRIGFEKVERPTESSFFLEDTPVETFEDVGGLDVQVEHLQRSIRLQRDHADVVLRYALSPIGSALLVGPPGTGKTLLARALANWLATLSPSGRSRFMNIKPAGLHSQWYGQSEANYREAFRIAREAGKAQPDVPVVMFFDEIDAVGAARSVAGQRVDDRVLTALMTELDGLESRGNVLVVAATNRRDALDPALLRPGRLGDLILEVPRPDRAAATEILAKHLDPDIPYHDDGRAEIIEVAASRMYAPNADLELATLTLRDGTRRTVGPRDLVSGAILENIAVTAIERACVRDVEGGAKGVAARDLLAAIDTAFENAAHALSPHNAARFVAGLPQDVDVVRVEPLASKARPIHRYLDVA